MAATPSAVKTARAPARHRLRDTASAASPIHPINKISFGRIDLVLTNKLGRSYDGPTVSTSHRARLAERGGATVNRHGASDAGDRKPAARDSPQCLETGSCLNRSSRTARPSVRSRPPPTLRARPAPATTCCSARSRGASSRFCSSAMSCRFSTASTSASRSCR
ncbi:hypothetical protein PSP6_230079 [Paraburkholderia tropica]|nr:hypothetical protein PSP6_230079 [Paraburkholderia tropica]